MADPLLMLDATLDGQYWAAVPFHFWSVVFFVFGSIVGSFLNVVIHRLPLGQSIVHPPSHCPHCQYSIPWYLNIPLLTWIYLGGKCRNCRAPISIRYFLVELLTATLFLLAWLFYGNVSPLLALVYSGFLAMLIAATFIDFEHFIIPDEITLGGAAAGFLLSIFIPALHGATSLAGGMRESLVGLGFGAGLVYFVLRFGKLVFGRQKLVLPPDARIQFGEHAVHLPEKDIPYEEIFYRESDVIRLEARTVELVDRCYKDVPVRLGPHRLLIGDEELNPETVIHMEVVSSQIVLPREAMGLGDVKFMAAIGAFLGWKAVIFSLMISSMIGALVGVTLILMRKQAWSSRLPYGPYIAAAAAFWIFGGREVVNWWFSSFQ
jgi:leader peptidase (prepilin peptidase) / N-methyltransferase